MADELTQFVGDTIPCRDEECPGRAEYEVDGDHRFRCCDTCGFEFAHERMEGTTLNSDNCGIGVPETLRRRASAAMEGAMSSETSRQPVPISIGFGAPKESQ